MNATDRAMISFFWGTIMVMLIVIQCYVDKIVAALGL